MRRNISALRRVAALLLCVLLACGAFAGCSQVEEIVSGVAATGEFPVEVNGVNIQSRPSRVVVLSPSLADVVLALGYETQLAGASEECSQSALHLVVHHSAHGAVGTAVPALLLKHALVHHGQRAEHRVQVDIHQVFEVGLIGRSERVDRLIREGHRIQERCHAAFEQLQERRGHRVFFAACQHRVLQNVEHAGVIGAQNLAEINAAYPVPPQENVDANFHALAAASTDFSASCDGQSVECGANISLYNSNSQTFSDSTNLPPQGTGYLQLMLMVPKGWQQLSVTYMPTFAADKTMTFVMTAADVTRA